MLHGLQMDVQESFSQFAAIRILNQSGGNCLPGHKAGVIVDGISLNFFPHQNEVKESAFDLSMNRKIVERQKNSISTNSQTKTSWLDIVFQKLSQTYAAVSSTC